MLVCPITNCILSIDIVSALCPMSIILCILLITIALITNSQLPNKNWLARTGRQGLLDSIDLQSSIYINIGAVHLAFA